MNYLIAHHNWMEHEGQILLTNDMGKYCFLTQAEFSEFIDGQLSLNSNTFDMLKEKGFLYQDKDKYISEFKCDMAEMKQCLSRGTNLLILVLTNCCNQRCVYCQAGEVHTNKTSVEVCKKAINLAVQSPVSHMTVEFQGGEPTLNPEALQFTVPYAKKVFAEHGKIVDFNIVSNMTSPDPELLRWLIEQDVHLSTSLDGNRSVHEYNRPLSTAHKSSYDAWHEGMELYKKLCKECCKKATLSAIQTTTRESLKFPKEIIDEYISNGMNNLYLRPLTPLGYALSNWDVIGYTPEEYVDFYCQALDYMMELTKHGHYVVESTASIYLTRILNKESVGHMEYRSPCGAAVGQIAVNFDGNVYTCDEGRMIANMGDPIFRLGTVDNTYRELLQSPVAHAVCTASCIEALPICCDCVYSPYCAVCPVVTYGIEGDLISRDEYAYRCVIAKGIINHLFKIIQRDNPDEIDILQRWANDRA